MKDDVNTLALDLGTRLGWATHRGGIIRTGCVNLQPRKGVHQGQRYADFMTFLDQTAFLCHIDSIVYEDVRRHLGTIAAHVYGGLLATVANWAAVRSIPMVGYGVGTIKKYATGKGNATKDMMIAAAQQSGRDIDNDNEADAYWLLKLHLSEVSK